MNNESQIDLKQACFDFNHWLFLNNYKPLCITEKDVLSYYKGSKSYTEKKLYNLYLKSKINV